MKTPFSPICTSLSLLPKIPAKRFLQNRLGTSLIYFILLACFTMPAFGQTRWHVNAATGNDTYTGKTWQQAFGTLVKAISQAQAGDQIWVARGTYYPAATQQAVTPTSYFILKEGVKIYGGFSGSEASLAERDFTKLRSDNESVLSGNGVSYHVVYNNNRSTNKYNYNPATLTAATILDGFTITGGHADLFYNSDCTDCWVLASGAAIYNDLGSPIFQNLWVKNNVAKVSGGGIYNNGSASFKNVLIESNRVINGTGGGMKNKGNSTLKDVTFIANQASQDGGGLWNDGDPSLEDVIFKQNVSGSGGGMLNTGKPSLNRVSFIANTSSLHGAGMWTSGIPELDNIVFSRNRVSSTSGRGGGIYINNGTASLNSVTFSKNTIAYVNAATGTSYGGALFLNNGSATINNSIFWGNTRGNGVADQLNVNAGVTLANSIIQNNYSGTNVITGDPLFADAANDNLQLTKGSLAVDAGQNAQVSTDKDVSGQSRIFHGNVDLGAYEKQDYSELLGIEPSSLNAVNRGATMDIQLQATGGTGPYTWSVQAGSGNLPVGLRLEADGRLHGNPTYAGTYAFVVWVTDSGAGSNQMVGSRQYTLQVDGAGMHYFVKADATGDNNGSSWQHAFTNLQTALSQAQAGDEIWVARGRYFPASPVAATSYFKLKEGVKIYGGFSGNEADLASRDLSQLRTANETILDGNNVSYHVVFNNNNSTNPDSYNPTVLTNATVLDGFSITGGHDDFYYTSDCSTCAIRLSGGGIHNDLGAPVFRNLWVKNNLAKIGGGGIYNSGAATFDNVLIENNQVTGGSGGGMKNKGNSILKNLTFVANEASQDGGGLWNDDDPSLEDVVFKQNISGAVGGGMVNSGNPSLNRVSFIANTSSSHGGGMWTSGTPELDNVVFSKNSVSSTSGRGGGIYINNGTASLNNVTFSKNTIAYVNAATGTSYGGALFQNSGSANVTNSIFWGNTRGNAVSDQLNAGVSVSYSIVQDNYAGTNILVGDPMFIDPVNNQLKLSKGSSAVDGGQNAQVSTDKDLGGQSRIVNNTVDLGAYEKQDVSPLLDIQPASLAAMSRGALLNIQLTATGGAAPYTWSLQPGANNLPVGLRLETDGRLHGNPTVAGTYSFVVWVTDSGAGNDQMVGSRQYTLQVNPGDIHYFVNDDATGDNNGSSWEHAFTNLQTAIAQAGAGDEIWVAKGTYYPAASAAAVTTASTFTLKDGVKIFGGFAGTEASLAERDMTKLRTQNETILDGYQKSYHVVSNTSATLNANTVLDGFSITQGKTVTVTGGCGCAAAASGAGIYNEKGAPVFSNLWVKNNIADYQGGGVFNTGLAVFNNVLIENNKVLRGTGGGMYNTAAVSLQGVSFIANESTGQSGVGGQGGGLYNGGDPSLQDVVFKQNTAAISGGGMFTTNATKPVLNRVSFIANTSVQHGGGLISYGSPKLDNVVFSRNKVTGTAYYGGGMHSNTGGATLNNVTFSNNSIAKVDPNTMVAYGSALFLNSGTATVSNSIFWGNTRGNDVADQLNAGVIVSSSIVQNSYPGTNILVGDPLFVDASGDNLQLRKGSLAVDGGQNVQLTDKDLAGQPRVVNNKVDLGAYEKQDVSPLLDIQPASLAAMSRGAMLNIQLTATGGAAPYTWSLQAGANNLPVGLRLETDGRLHGNPTVAGTYSFVVWVSDSGAGNDQMVGSRQYNLQVNPGGIHYFVKTDATGDNNGSSWEHAFTNLQTALTQAGAGDEIWVAKGTYYPAATQAAVVGASSFTLKEGVKIYGGFAGTEASLAERDMTKLRTQNETILDGNQKSYHVVYNNATLSANTVLDGFSVTGGKTVTVTGGCGCADEASGAGIYNATGAPVFRNLWVKGNTADYQGGGVFNTGLAVFNNVLIENNKVLRGTGGGMYNTAAASLQGVRFVANESTGQSGVGGQGGGLYNGGGDPSLQDVVFKQNTAAISGGGMFTTNATKPVLNRVSFIANSSVQHGGGLISYGSPKLDNVVFSRNKVTGTAYYGGGMYANTGSATLNNITFSSNSIAKTDPNMAVGYGGALFLNSGSVSVSNSIFWGNTRGNGVADQLNAGITVSGSIVQNGYAGGTNILVGDPLFTDASGDNLQLSKGSLAVDGGQNAPVTTDKDVNGQTRIVNSTVDLGAYEKQDVSPLLDIQPASLAAMNRGALLNIQLTAGGGTAPYSWSLQAGANNLPPGIRLEADGRLHGNPTVAGNFSFVVWVSDSGTGAAQMVGSRQYNLQVNPAGMHYFVNDDAAGDNNGSSWEHAFTNLQTAIAQAGAGDEIWVAKGTYYPAASAAAVTTASTFTLKDGVKIYGGFAGTEASLAERDMTKLRTQNETILDGNQKSYHVVYNNETLSASTVLDGFSITQGKTVTVTGGCGCAAAASGAGIYNEKGAPVFSNLWVKNNIADYQGGGVFNTGLAAFNNVLIENNKVLRGTGGGMYNTAAASLQGVSFIANESAGQSGIGGQGGGLYNGTGDISLQDVVFKQNIAALTGGGMQVSGLAKPVLNRVSFIANISGQNGAGLAIYGSPKLDNVVFSRNRVTGTGAYYGGGMYVTNGAATLNNVTFSNNSISYVNAATGTSYGGALFLNSGSAIVTNSIFWGNTRGNGVADQLNAGVTVSGSIVQNGYAGGTNILVGDPLFTDASGDNLQLSKGSLAVDGGQNAPVTTDKDVSGQTRIVNSTVDLGAYEKQDVSPLLDIQPASLAAMNRGTLLNIQLTAGGGTAPFTWSLQAGANNLPPGIRLEADGRLHGNPTVAGNFSFVVWVSDSGTGAAQMVGSRQYNLQVNPAGMHYFVNDDATGDNNGSSWEHAFTNLQTAIAQASSGDEIWVAKGVYYTASPVIASSAFTLKEGVKIYGGFAGTEASLGERDLSKLRTDNQSKLDGNNISRHVVFNTSSLSNATALDGFTITGGKTDTGTNGEPYQGGGIYNTAGSAVFSNLWIRDNVAYYYGGGIYNTSAASFNDILLENNKVTFWDGGGMYNGAASTLIKVSFKGNSAARQGGGLWNNSAATLTDLSFTANTAVTGGGLYNTGAAVINRASFINNSATQFGGGLWTSGTPKLDNVVFSRNKVTTVGANYGGGMYINSGTITLNNATFSSNTIAYVNANTSSYGGAFYLAGGSANISNSIFWGNKRGNAVPDQLNAGTVSKSLVQGGYNNDTQILTLDPLFVNAGLDDLTLQPCSPAINKGDNSKVTGITRDVANNERIKKDIVDLGAYEYQGAYPTDPPALEADQWSDYTYQITAGEDESATYTLSAGNSLPSGLTLDANGTLHGMPKNDGVFQFFVDVKGSAICGSVKVQLTVHPKAPYIAQINNPAAVTVNSGLSFEQLVQEGKLPAQVDAVLIDGNHLQVPVQWQSGDYNQSHPGIYSISGLLQVSAEQNKLNLKAAIQVKILKDIASVSALTGRTVVYGTPYEQLNLPSTVAVTYNDGSVADLSVSWTSANYTQAGVPGVTLKGELTLESQTTNLQNLTAEVNVTITPASLTVRAASQTKTYDGVAFSGGNGVSYEGFVSGDNLSKLSGNLTYGGNAQGAKNAGTYAITPGGFTSTNYTITYIDGTLTITPAALTIRAVSQSKIYDGVAYSGGNDVNYEGFVSGDDASKLSGSLTYGGSAEGAKNAGTYTITPSGYTSANYTISYVDGSLTITPAPLTVRAKSLSKTYDGVAYSGGNGVNYEGFVTGDDASKLSGNLIYGGSAQGAKNAGTYMITPSGYTSANYVITYADGSFTITPAALTVRAVSDTKTYDGVAYSGGNGVSYEGFVPGDDASTLSGNLTYGGSAYGAKNVGTYTITPGGYTSTNYTITYADGTLTITPAALTIRANSLSKAYDGVAYSGGSGVSYEGFASDDDASKLSGSLTYGGSAQGAKDVGSYTITPSGYTSANYTITYADGALTITPAALTIRAASQTKSYDGVAYSGGNGVGYEGFVSGDDASKLSGILTYVGNAQGAKDVGTYTITPSGYTSANYTITYADGTLTITPAALTIRAASQGKTYDGVAYSGGNGVSYEGFIQGDDVSKLNGSLIYGGSAQGAKDAGSYVITPSGFTSANYTINYADGTLTITPAPLTIRANSLSKIYDGVAYNGGDGVSYEGFVPGDDASKLSGNLTYGGSAQGARSVGSYVIAPSGFTSVNYTISYADGSLTITPAALTIRANSLSKTYDGVAYSGGDGVSYEGFVSGDDASGLSGNLTYAGNAQGAKNVGSYVITPSGYTSANYIITYADGNLTITPAALTIRANSLNKTYDGVAFSGGNGVNYEGFVEGDDASKLSGNLTYGGNAQGTKNVGSYLITPSGYTSVNYTITYADGTLTITPAALTVRAIAQSKTYDGIAYSGGNGVSYEGFVEGDDASKLSGSLTYGGSAQGAKNVGSYLITPSGFTSANYTITYADGTLNITAAALTVRANSLSKTYDGVAYSGGNGVSYEGFVSGDDASSLSGTLSYGGSAQGAKNAGSYVITPSGYTSANYTISYADGNLVITPAALTIRANSLSKTYNGVAYSGGTGVNYEGFVSGDNASQLSGILTYGGSAQGAKNVGSYVIAVSGYTSPNYTITYVDGNLTITPASLTVRAASQSKSYDGVAYSGGNGVSYEGFVSGDDASKLSGSLTYGGNAQGAKAVGTYTITPGGYTSANYTITYADGTLDITPAALTIRAVSQSKVYDGVAYSGGNGVSYEGFLPGDDASKLSGSLTYGGSAQGAKDAGSYPIVPSGYTSANYTITYVNGTLTITPAALTVRAASQGKTYDGVAYSGGNGVTYEGFVSGDDASTLSGTLTYGGSAQGAKNAGFYVISPSGYTSANYTITYADGTLTITPAALTIRAVSQSKTYDGVAYSGGNGVSYEGFVSGDNVSKLSGNLTYAGSAQGAKDTGTYTITPSGYTSVNYTITYADGTLTITPAALTIRANSLSKTYDGLAYSGGNGISYEGFVAGDGASQLSGSLTYGGSAQGAKNIGSYKITPAGYTSANYTITYADGTLTITPAALIVRAVSQSKIYDGQIYSGGNGVIYEGFAQSDDASKLSGSLIYGGNAQGAKNAGTYTIAPGGYTSANYTITYVDGTLTITPAVLTIRANSSSKTYDGVAYSGGNGVGYEGFVSGDDASKLSGNLTYGGSAQGAKAAGSYVITPSGYTSTNYTINYADGTLTITPAALTIRAVSQSKTYDGVAYNGGNGVIYEGFVSGDNASKLSGTLTYSGSAQGAKHVGTYVITPGGYTSSNYTINYVDGGLTINKALLTISAASESKTYDGLAYSGGKGVSYQGFVSGDNASVLTGTLTYGGSAQGAKHVGTYAIKPGGYTSVDYTITYVEGSLTITPAALTIRAASDSKTYDGLAYSGGKGISYEGLVSNEDASVLTGSLTYGGSAQGAKHAGTYVIKPGGYTSSNYTINYVDGSLTINKAALTISAASDSKTYDGLAYSGGKGVSCEGFVSDDNVSVLTGSLTYGGSAQGAKHVGTYVIQPTGYTSSDYTINYVDGELMITPAALTISAASDSKTYDGLAYSGGKGVSYDGFVAGEDVSMLTGSLTYGGSAQGAKHVGTYVIQPGGYTSSDYTIVYIDGNLTITPAALTIRAASDSKAYDGVAYSGGKGVSYEGFASVDNLSALTGSLTYSGSAQGAKHAGTYVIEPGGYTSSDYTINYVNGSLTITPAELTISAASDSKTYDGLAYSGGKDVSFEGFADGDNESKLSGSLTYGGSAQGAKHVGTYVIKPAGLTSGDYTIKYVDGSLTITPAALTIRAASDSKIYDALTYSGGKGVSYEGFVAGEDASVLTGSLTYGGSAQGAKNVGSYAISPRGLVSSNADYDINYANGTLTIEPKEAFVKVKSSGKVYGAADPILEGQLDGFVETDQVTATYVREQGEQVGRYKVSASLNAAPGKLENYHITVNQGEFEIRAKQASIVLTELNQNYNGQPKSVKVSTVPEGLKVDLTYNGSTELPVAVGNYQVEAKINDPNYTGSSNGILSIGQASATIALSNLIYTYDGGVKTAVATTQPAGLKVKLSYSQNGEAVVAPKNAGAYQVSAVIDDANYKGSAECQLLIKKAQLTVVADDKFKMFGAQNPPLTLAYKGFVNQEDENVLDVKPVISTVVNSTTEPGRYPIHLNEGSDNNYDLKLIDGWFTVKAELKTQTITFAPLADQTYGDGPVDLQASASSGLLPVFSVVSGPARIQGNKVIIDGAGEISIRASQPGNDDFLPAADALQSFKVCKKTLTLSADNLTRPYGESNPVLSFTVKGFIPGEGMSNIKGLPLLSTAATATSLPGLYPVTIKNGSLSSSDYDFKFLNGTLTITGKVPQSIQFPAIAKLRETDKPFELNARSSSGLPIKYESSDTSVVMIKGNTLIIRRAGPVIITASQPGDDIYLPASAISQTLLIERATLVVSQVLTPNQDGINDVWMIPEIDRFPDNEITVIDRNGQIVYKARNYKNDWDGTYKGHVLPNDTYYYRITFGRSGEKPITGFITLILN